MKAAGGVVIWVLATAGLVGCGEPDRPAGHALPALPAAPETDEASASERPSGWWQVQHRANSPGASPSTSPSQPALPEKPGAGGLPPEPGLPAVTQEDVAILQARGWAFPVGGVSVTSIRDGFDQSRREGAHEALDIAAPEGTPVFAVEDGTVVKLFTSQRGGLTLYQYDPTRRYAYYYAHLQGYADGLKEGQKLRRCQLIGYVGSTGNANPAAPHLHFAIFKLEAAPRWWRGTAVNPYPVLAGLGTKAGAARPCETAS